VEAQELELSKERWRPLLDLVQRRWLSDFALRLIFDSCFAEPSLLSKEEQIHHCYQLDFHHLCYLDVPLEGQQLSRVVVAVLDSWL
jgi:hypothetical protein